MLQFRNCVITGGVAFLAGFFLTFLFVHQTALSDCESDFKYTAPELNCLSSDTNRLQALEATVQGFVDDIKRGDPSIMRVSVFYRNLKTHRWFGVNERVLFTPGSLLKIPLAIAYHKYSEISPTIFENYITYQGLGDATSDNKAQHIQPPEYLVPGTQYKVSDLIRRLLVYSDNDAIIPLFSAVEPIFYDKVLRDFDIILPKDSGIERDFVTAKTYGVLFRALYNASYLNREESEELLSTMVETLFKDGLVAGVPRGVPVAHKFGERSYTNGSSTAPVLEFHDCGIVYHSTEPYILCVMTEGKSFEKQVKLIETISRLVYNAQN